MARSGWLLGGAAVLIGFAVLAGGKEAQAEEADDDADDKPKDDEKGSAPKPKPKPKPKGDEGTDPPPGKQKTGHPPMPDFISGLIWPLPGVDKRKPKGGGKIGASRGSKNGVPKLHAGTDIYAPAGSLVIAMEGGFVENTVNGWANEGSLGDTARILIQGDSGYVENYAAISKKSWKEFGLKEGDRVEAGQPLGRIGTYPGGSTMLHFELYRTGTHDNKRWFKDALPSQLRHSGQWLEWSSETHDEDAFE